MTTKRTENADTGPDPSHGVDPADTDHPAGEEHAADNAAGDPPS